MTSKLPDIDYKALKTLFYSLKNFPFIYTNILSKTPAQGI